MPKFPEFSEFVQQQSIEFVQPVKFVQSIELVQPAKLFIRVVPVFGVVRQQSIESVQPIQPIEPIKLVDGSKPVLRGSDAADNSDCDSDWVWWRELSVQIQWIGDPHVAAGIFTLVWIQCWSWVWRDSHEYLCDHS